MIRQMLLLSALLLIAACATDSRSGGTLGSSSAAMPAYIMMKDDVLSAKVDAFAHAMIDDCAKLAADAAGPCMRKRAVQSLPNGDLAAAHCAAETDVPAELDCIMMAALASDLIERSGKRKPAAFLQSMGGGDHSKLTGESAIEFAKSVWDSCPDGTAVEACRIATTLAKLDLPPTEQTRCAPLAEDRKIVSCLILSRFRNLIETATGQLGA